MVWVWEVAGNRGVFACPPLPLHTRGATGQLIPKRIKAPRMLPDSLDGWGLLPLRSYNTVFENVLLGEVTQDM